MTSKDKVIQLGALSGLVGKLTENLSRPFPSETKSTPVGCSFLCEVVMTKPVGKVETEKNASSNTAPSQPDAAYLLRIVNTAKHWPRWMLKSYLWKNKTK